MEATAATIDEHPMWINMEPAREELAGYPEAEIDYKVLLCIAGYANSKGIAWPTQRCVAHQTGYSATTVCASTKRLQDKDWLAVVAQKKMKKTDRHPRNIYAIASDTVRETPDMRSSHFDAEKWRVIAARLKKHVSKAVDNLKQVAVGFAQNMANARKRKHSKKQWKQNNPYQNNSYQNNSYRNNSWQRNSYSVPAQPLSPEERERERWIHHLIEQGQDALEKAHMTSDGEFEAWRYLANQVKKTPEKYDQILQTAIEKFKDYVAPDPMEAYEQDANGHWWLKKDYKSHVPNVRLMSSEDEPTTLGGILGGAFA